MNNKVIYLNERINKRKIERNKKGYEEHLSEMYADQLGENFKNILNENKSKSNERGKKQ